MSRRLPAVSLFVAWLCASGAMLDVAQVFAWARMFTGYARNESVVAAVRDTFDPARPCALCCALSKARQAEGRGVPAAPAMSGDRIILILDRPEVFVAESPERAWPDDALVRPAARTGDVPVPPPRDTVA
jgi:hypothetical protein